MKKKIVKKKKLTAKDGYFMAKREMQEALNNKLLDYEKALNRLEQTSDNVTTHRILSTRINMINKINSFIKNVMLWNTKND